MALIDIIAQALQGRGQQQSLAESFPQSPPMSINPFPIDNQAVEQYLSQPPMPVAPQMSVAPQPTPPIPQSIPRPSGDVSRTREEGEEATRSNDNRRMLMNILARMGVPLGAAIAGSVNPNLLPQTAGLATGYAKGIERQEDIAREELGTKPFIVYDPETGEEKTIQVPKNAIVQQKRKDNSFWSQLGIDPTKLDIPTEEEETVATQVLKKVRELNIPGAPSAKDKPNGSKLKDENGNIVAESKDGKWVSSQ